jgi:autotransporter-associated beta strand protein
MNHIKITLAAALVPLLFGTSELFGQSNWIGLGTSGTPALWSVGGNWAGTAPTDNATVSLVFNNEVANSWSNNDLTGLTVSSILVPATFNAINVKDNTVTGNAITLSGGFTVNTGNFQTFGMNIALASGAGSFNQTTGQTTFGGQISGSQNITKIGGGTVIFAGNNTFAGSVAVNAGGLNLSGTNTFAGDVTVANGAVVRLSNNTGLGSTAGKITMSSGGRLELSNNITVTGETAEIQGNGGDNTFGGVIRNVSGNNTWTGNVVTVGNDSRIIAAAGTLTISGVISSNNVGNNQVIFRGQGGTIEVTNANTYGGTTRVFGTPVDTNSVMLRISGGDNRLPVGTSIDIGGGGVSGHMQILGVSQEVAGLVSNGGATASRISGVGAATLVLNNASTGTFTGSLTDSLAFTKRGVGIYTLTNAANDYSRGTIVEAGILATGATGDLGTGNVRVLGAAGLTLGNFLSIADTSDLSFTSTSSIGLSFTGTEVVRMLNNTTTNAFMGIGTWNATQLNAFFGGSVFSGAGLLQVTAIPEPSSFAVLAGLGALGFVASRRRRR